MSGQMRSRTRSLTQAQAANPDARCAVGPPAATTASSQAKQGAQIWPPPAGLVGEDGLPISVADYWDDTELLEEFDRLELRMKDQLTAYRSGLNVPLPPTAANRRAALEASLKKNPFAIRCASRLNRLQKTQQATPPSSVSNGTTVPPSKMTNGSLGHANGLHAKAHDPSALSLDASLPIFPVLGPGDTPSSSPEPCCPCSHNQQTQQHLARPIESRTSSRNQRIHNLAVDCVSSLLKEGRGAAAANGSAAPCVCPDPLLSVAASMKSPIFYNGRKLSVMQVHTLLQTYYQVGLVMGKAHVSKLYKDWGQNGEAEAPGNPPAPQWSSSSVSNGSESGSALRTAPTKEVRRKKKK